MTDLSKIPDLELRQKIKPINDRMDAIDAQIATLKAEHKARWEAAIAPLQAERDKLDEQLNEIDGPDIVGTCQKTGLPLFEGDETVTSEILAAVA